MLMLIYLIAGYWAVGQTIWRNKVIIEFRFGAAFMQRAVLGLLFGWILIPVALIMKLLSR